MIISSILSNCPSILWWISNLTGGFRRSPFATTLQRVQKARKITCLLISDAGCISHPRRPLWSPKVNEENVGYKCGYPGWLRLSILRPRLILENHPRDFSKYNSVDLLVMLPFDTGAFTSAVFRQETGSNVKWKVICSLSALKRSGTCKRFKPQEVELTKLYMAPW